MYMFWLNISEMFFKDRERWFLWLPVLFGCGIGLYFVLPVDPSKWISLVIIEVLLLCAYLTRHKPEILLSLGILGIILAGFVNVQLKTLYIAEHQANRIIEQKMYLKGLIEKVDTNYNGKLRITLSGMQNFDDEKIEGKYKLTLISKKQKIEAGKCVEMVANVTLPPKPALVGAYQGQRKAFFEGVDAIGYVESGIYNVECKQKASLGQKFWWKIEKIRQKIADKIKEQ